MGNSSKGLGIIALILAIVAVMLGAWPIVFPSASIDGGPRIYVSMQKENMTIVTTGLESIPDLNLKYTTSEGESVLIEYSCQVEFGALSDLEIYFKLDVGSALYYLDLHETSGNILNISASMENYIESSTAGEHTVAIDTYASDPPCIILASILTVTVF